MSKNAIIALVVIVILAIGAYFLFAHKAAAPTIPAQTAAAENAPASSTADTGAMPSIVNYTDSGFSPNTLTVKLGTTVRFVNDSSHGMWVAVGNHPTHTTYDGTSEQQHCSNGMNTNGSFDECTAVNPGTVYSFTFMKTGTFTFHNHVQSSDGGTITITS